MSDGRDILRRLAEPFPPKAVSWRIGLVTKDEQRARALAYIDARDVMDRLDEVCGADWQCDYPLVSDSRTVCRISIKIDGEWRHRECGAGDTNIEGAKGGLSDAFKRAAVKWGIGRYLYQLGSPLVQVEKRGRAVDIKTSEYGRLAKLLAEVMPSEDRAGTDGGHGPSEAQRTRVKELAQRIAHARHPEGDAAAAERRRRVYAELLAGIQANSSKRFEAHTPHEAEAVIAEFTQILADLEHGDEREPHRPCPS